jgi:hypothetical protein
LRIEIENKKRDVPARPNLPTVCFKKTAIVSNDDICFSGYLRASDFQNSCVHPENRQNFV